MKHFFSHKIAFTSIHVNFRIAMTNFAINQMCVLARFIALFKFYGKIRSFSFLKSL